MNKVFRLSRILRKCGSSNNNEKESNDLTNTIALLVFAGIVAVALFFFGRALDSFSVVFGSAVTIMKILFVMGALISIFYVFPAVINQLYMSSDLPMLLTMPYKPSQIVLARLINLIRLPAVVCITLSVPAAVGYATSVFSPTILIGAILSAIFTPCIVLSFAGIITVMIMTCVHGIRNKDFLRTVGIILLFAVIVLVNIFVRGDNMTADTMTRVAAGLGSFADVLPINFALGALMDSFSILALLEIIGITAAFVLVFWLLVSKFYLTGALAMQDTAAGNAHIGEAALKRGSKGKSILKSLMLRDFKMVAREPAYLMNGFLYSLFFPILMVFSISFAGNKGIGASLSSASSMESIVAFVLQNSILLTFSATLSNSIASSPISREGKSFGVLKALPLDNKTVIRAKRNVSLLICGLGSTLYVTIGGLILVFMGYLPLWSILYGLSLNIPLLFYNVDSNMLHDIKKPNMNWESEAEMLKDRNGLGALVTFLVGIAAAIILATMLQIFGEFIPNLWIPVMIGSTAVSILVGVFQDRRLIKKGCEILEKMF